MAADGTTPTASVLASERLADVLSALTDESRGAWLAILRKYGGALPRDVRFNRDAIRWGKPWQATEAGGMREARVYQRSWLTIPDARHPDGAVTHAHLVTPAEALELLATRGVWPWEVGVDAAPRWWCAACEGSGRVEVWASPDGERESDFCGDCAVEDLGATGGWCATGHTDAPPSLPALVAAASNPRLREAVALAREIAGDAWATVVLRVVARSYSDGPGALIMEPGRMTPVEATAKLNHQRDAFGSPWPDECPFYYNASVHRAWPALRALAACQVHLLALAPGRVVLGIAAVGAP